MESFGGITLTRAAVLVRLGLIDTKYMDTILNVTEMVKKQIESHFDVTKLYFSYTHLVCRSAMSGSMVNRTDFSHNVHADNCNLHPSGNCEKALPSYTSRDYSAIVYLNDDFIGGEFIFVSDYYGKLIQSSIKPKCGRMVAFSSGVENLHAVKAVRKGTRCAIAIWFTFNVTETENRTFIYDMIKDND